MEHKGRPLGWVVLDGDGRPTGPMEISLVPIAACLAIAWLFFETARDGTQFRALLIALAVIVLLYAKNGRVKHCRLE